MITYTQGNLLEAQTEALVNTVNTVGVMGKGIALMFKERFAENFRLYAAACKNNQLHTGKMFVTEVHELNGLRWIVNFPTKQSWRAPSQMQWIVDGLQDLRRFLIEKQVRSIAIPALGAGNGGLQWSQVRVQIEAALKDLNTHVHVYEPTTQYLNVTKRTGKVKLTPARALIAELTRRYSVLGMECSLLELQKLAWFLERSLAQTKLAPLDLGFKAHLYGPYADKLRHILDGLDGSYLHCSKRISDASPLDTIWFDDTHQDFLQTYLHSEAKAYTVALERTAALIDGFESPYGMELLASVDWLLSRENIAPTVAAVREGLRHWPGGKQAAARKNKLFDDRALGIALKRLVQPEFN